MDIFWPVFEVVVNILQGALFAYVGVSIFDSKPKFTTDLYYFFSVWLSCSALLTVMTYFPLSFMFLDIVIITSLFIILTIIFRKEAVFTKIFWSLAYFGMFACIIYFTLSIATSLLDVTIDFLHSNSSGRLIYVFAVNAVIVSMSFVFIRVARHSVDGAMKLQVIVASTALIMSNLVVLLLLLKYASITPDGFVSPAIPIISSAAIFIANTLVLWMFQHIYLQNAKVMQLSAAEQRIELQTRHLEEMKHITHDLSKFRHDTHHHFQHVLALAKKRKSRKIVSYIRMYVRELDALPTMSRTGNITMDAILDAKSQVASHEFVNFTVDARLPDRLPVSENDLVVIMGNILDNAIEASSQLADIGDRCVHVYAQMKSGTMTITVMNKMADKPQKRNYFALTDRLKGGVHGLGLRILHDRVTKYGGYVNTNSDGQTYKVSIVIPTSKKN